MRLAIDAHNLRDGGGLTHLVELLAAADPPAHGFDSVTVWANEATLDCLPDRPWLNRASAWLLNGPLPARLCWQRIQLPALLSGQDLLFVPGGTYIGSFRPFVVMSRNLLPFDIHERIRFGLSMRLRFVLLERVQAASFRCASGVIFLTGKAREVVEKRMGGPVNGEVAVIPHGVSDVFRHEPRSQRSLAACSSDDPFRWLYVSSIMVYKHQWHVAEAIAKLRMQGLPVALDLIGPPTPEGLRRLRESLARFDPMGAFIRYLGPVSYAELTTHYHKADGFVFASSCETFGQILVEAMSAGLPIACSDRSAMPEILGNAGLYFDPERPETIASAMTTLMDDPLLRERLSWAAYARAQYYSWGQCARETFSFLARVAGTRSVDTKSLFGNT